MGPQWAVGAMGYRHPMGQTVNNRTRAACSAARPLISAAKAQALDELLVLLGLGRFQIIEKLAALIDELHEPAPRGMIALVCGKVITEGSDTLLQERDLY